MAQLPYFKHKEESKDAKNENKQSSCETFQKDRIRIIKKK
jgi:dGTP triphosphohydrolase